MVANQNFQQMRQLVAQMDQIRFEGKADNISNAIAYLTKTNSMAIKMYGFDKSYVFNPDFSLYKNKDASNSIAIVAPEPLMRNGKKQYMSVTFILNEVDSTELPSWYR